MTSLSASYPDYDLRPRIGTRLWLGDRGALSVRAAVLDVHPVERGDVFGYRGRSAPKAGTIVVVMFLLHAVQRGDPVRDQLGDVAGPAAQGPRVPRLLRARVYCPGRLAPERAGS